MTAESSVQRSGWLRVARTSVMWRLSTGMAWMSNLGPKGVHWSKDRTSVRIDAPRPIATGLGLASGHPVVGAGDLVGRTTVVITDAMVGKSVAVFTSLEAKHSNGGRRRVDQVNWHEQTVAAGGISGFFSSPEEAEQIISDWHKKMQQP